jgi:hypothetical protein
VEGVFDAYRVWESGFLAVALNGKTVPEHSRKKLLTILGGCEKVYVFLDPKAEAASNRVSESLGLYVDVQNVKGCSGGKDPADLSTQELKEIIK